MAPILTIRWGITIACWIGMLLLALNLHQFNYLWPHPILCGAWGCSPVLPALAGYHLFSLVILLPAIPLSRLLPNQKAKVVGRWLCLGAAFAGAGVIFAGGLQWLMHRREPSFMDILRKSLYDLVMLLDIPLMQIALIGAMIYLYANFSTTRKEIVGVDPALTSEHGKP